MKSLSIPKVIMVPFEGDEEERPALEYALNLAAVSNAHAQVWHFSLDPISAAAYALAGASVYPMYSEIERANEETKEAAYQGYLETIKRLKIENREPSNSIEAASASFHAVTGSAKNILSVKARMADLVVMARTDTNTGLSDVANGVLFGSARPVIFIPPDKKFFQANNSKVLIAWNGSREAARAVAHALPYLQDKEILILTSQEDKPVSLTDEDLKVYLARRGINAAILTHMDGGSPVGAAILNTAKLLEVGMIVMGAWSHSRAHEYILGGVTDYMLHHADIPVLMAH